MRALIVLVALAGVASADAPPPRYPRDFPLVDGAEPVPPNVAWMGDEGCEVVVLQYPRTSRDKLEHALRARLVAQGWTVRQQKWAAKGTTEFVARKKGRLAVPLIFRSRDAGAMLSVYRCEP